MGKISLSFTRGQYSLCTRGGHWPRFGTVWQIGSTGAVRVPQILWPVSCAECPIRSNAAYLPVLPPPLNGWLQEETGRGIQDTPATFVSPIHQNVPKHSKCLSLVCTDILFYYYNDALVLSA